MTRIAVEARTAEQLRTAEGPIELTDESGNTIGRLDRPPTEAEIRHAKASASRGGRRYTFEEAIAIVKKEVGL